MQITQIDDDERSGWIANDEGLYDLCQQSGMNEEDWIEENRDLIDEVITGVCSGEQSAHYLKYGKSEYGRI